MNNKNILTSKDVNLALKQPFGVTELMKNFGFEFPKELFEAVEKISLSGSGEYIRKLKNKLKSEKKSKNFSQQQPQNVSSPIVLNEIQDKTTSSLEESENVPAFTEQEVNEISDETNETNDVVFSELEELTALEARLSAEVRECEIQHKTFVSNKQKVYQKN